MKLQLSEVGPDGAAFDGEDPVETLAWPYTGRDVVRPAGPMRWHVEARLLGAELVCSGRADARFDGTCCRCGGPLSREYGDDFAVSLPVGPDQTEVDLTSELRETILLALPNHPVCSETCPGPPSAAPSVPRGAGGNEGGAGPWAALDALSGGKTHENKRPRVPQTPNKRHITQES